MPPLPNDEMCVADIVWSIESGAEIAVNRLFMQHQHFTGNSFGWGDALQTVADHVVSSIIAHGSDLLPLLHGDTHLARVDAYKLDATTGHATDKRSHICATGDFQGSDSDSHPMPPFVCAVVQLWGYPPAGFVTHPRRRRGRLFMPITNISAVDTQGLLSSTTRDNTAAAWAGILNDLQGMHVGSIIPDTGDSDFMEMGVLSRVDHAFYQLESVSVAQKPGIQRRRMNKLLSTAGSQHAISHG